MACFGPDAYAAGLEGSKAFAKEVMNAAGVPTAAHETFTDIRAARAYVEKIGAPLVVKADGLAAGKGVTVARTTAEALEALDVAMVQGAFGAAGATVVVEEALVGEEASFLAFCDGTRAVPMTACQDHKAAYDGDTGPNTAAWAPIARRRCCRRTAMTLPWTWSSIPSCGNELVHNLIRAKTSFLGQSGGREFLEFLALLSFAVLLQLLRLGFFDLLRDEPHLFAHADQPVARRHHERPV